MKREKRVSANYANFRGFLCTYIIPTLLALLFVLLFGSCSDPLQITPSLADDGDLASGMGRVTVSINGLNNERTALPDGPLELVEYEFVFIRKGETQASWRDTVSSPSVTVDLSSGVYNVIVNGYNGMYQVAASGTAEISIGVGQISNIQIQLVNAGADAGTGMLQTILNITEGVLFQRAEIFAYTLPGGGLNTYRLFESIEDQFYLPAGNHRITVSAWIYKDGIMLSSVRTIAAHIYVGHTTTITLDLDEASGAMGMEYTAGTAAELTAVLNSVRTGTGRNAHITITGNFPIAPIMLSDTGYNGKSISIQSADPELVHTITLSGNGSLFTVGSEQVSPVLVLSDIKLAGHNSNNAPLMRIVKGLVIMDNGAEISGNTNRNVESAQTFSGGGIAVEDGAYVKMLGGAIQNNTVNSDYGYNNNILGGGVVVRGTFEMYGGSISSNRLTLSGSVYSASGALGGGVMIESGGLFKLYDGIIQSNSLVTGIVVFGGTGVCVDGVLEMYGGSIKNHSTSGTTDRPMRGSGLYIRTSGHAAMNGGEISNNSLVNGFGAGVFTEGTFVLNDGEIHSNTVTGSNEQSRHGGGIFHERNILNLNGGKIYSNTANYGGGISIGRNSGIRYVTLNGTEISGNTAVRGAGIYSYGTNLTIENCLIENNYFYNDAWSGETDAYGAGVFFDGASTTVSLIMNGGSIKNNSINFDYVHPGSRLNAYGGGVAIRRGGSFTMNGGFIEGNYVRSTNNAYGESLAQGGGIYASDSSVTINSGHITGNSATPQTAQGGGIYISGSNGALTLNCGRVAANTAADGGGIYYIGEGLFRMRGGVISGNTAAGQGGGIMLGTGFGGFEKNFLGSSTTCGIIYGSEAEGTDEFGIELKNTGTGAAIRMLSPNRTKNTTVGETIPLFHNTTDNWAN